MRNPRAAIITAVASEMAAIRELLELEDFTDPDDGSVYMRGEFSNESPKPNCALKWDVVLPMPSSAGNVFAAITTERIAKTVCPDVIILVGCAGGIPGKANLFDVVVADKIFYYEPNKVDIDLLPRPDLARPTKRLIERAQAEHFSDRWYSFLKQHIPNEKPAVRIEPIAAGEVLLKNSKHPFMTHIKSVAPRSIAVEQEGYGLLMAAHAHHVHAIVVRGISDLLDDKGSDAAEDLSVFNPKQVKAARHAMAFAMSMLSNLDVTWIPEAEYEGKGRQVMLRVVLEGDIEDVKDVERHLLDWLRDGKLSGLRFSPGSIKAEFDVEPGHALILQAAFETGIVLDFGGHKVVSLSSSQFHAPRSAEELADAIRAINLDGTENQAAIQKLRDLAQLDVQYRHLVTSVLKIVSGVIENRSRAHQQLETQSERTSSHLRSWNHVNRDRVEALFGHSKGQKNDMLLDVNLGQRVLETFAESRYFFAWPNLGLFLRSVGMVRKQFDIQEFTNQQWMDRRSLSNSPSVRRSVVDHAARGKAMTYARCRVVAEGMNEICLELDIEPRACVIASVFTLQDTSVITSLPSGELDRMAAVYSIGHDVYRSIAEGKLVTFNVLLAVLESISSYNKAPFVQIGIPWSTRSRVSEAVEKLAAQNLLNPAREYYPASRLRSF